MTERLRVRAARNRRDLKRFIDLPYRLHARDPVWVPPLRRDVELLLSRTKNPFFEHAEAEYFIAERDGEVVGRIAAISNRLHNETHGDRVGFFGFFECIDDQAVADALLDAAPRPGAGSGATMSFADQPRSRSTTNAGSWWTASKRRPRS